MGRNYKKSTWGKTWDIFVAFKCADYQKCKKKKKKKKGWQGGIMTILW